MQNAKEAYISGKVKNEKSLKLSEETMENAERCILELQHTNDTLEQLATNIGDAETKSKRPNEHAPFLKPSEHNNQLVSRQAIETEHQESVVVIWKVREFIC